MDLMNFARTYWDRVAAVVCTLAGAVLLFLGWRGVSDTPYPAGQIPYVVSDGLGGLFLLGLASLLWLSADLRDEWTKLDTLDQHLEKLVELAGGEPAPGSSEVTVAPPAARGRSMARTARAPKAVAEAPEQVPAPEGTE